MPTVKNSAPRTPNFKKDFPIFESRPELVYLDSAATALKPRAVLEAVTKYYEHTSANVHRGLYRLSEEATEAYEGARATVQNFLHAASPHEIIFTRGTTEAINLAAYAWGEKHLRSGDEILLTILEHHSNIVPWQMLAKRKNCVLKYVDIDDRDVLKAADFSKLLSRRTRLLTLSHVSNALGTVTSLRPIIQKAHAVGAKVFVDAAQSAARFPLDVQYLDCDFLAFSGHKLYGPTGIGVLYAKEKILETMEPFMGGGGMILEVTKTKARWNLPPWKFEAGTPPIAEAIGLGAALRYLSEIGVTTIRSHEKKLLGATIATLQKIPQAKLFGPCNPEIQSGALSFNIQGIHAHDVAQILDDENIAVRAGHHCCMPLMERLKVPATVRVSFGIYNTEEDIEKLEDGLKKAIKIFKA